MKWRRLGELFLFFSKAKNTEAEGTFASCSPDCQIALINTGMVQLGVTRRTRRVLCRVQAASSDSAPRPRPPARHASGKHVARYAVTPAPRGGITRAPSHAAAGSVGGVRKERSAGQLSRDIPAALVHLSEGGGGAS